MAGPTATISKSQREAMRGAAGLANSVNHDGATLETQDDSRPAGYCIYVYNILNLEHFVYAAPKFPVFRVPPCPPGEKFAYTTLPAFSKERFERTNTDRAEYFYKNMDGRKDATTLLNPAAFPSTNWESQLANWEAMDQAGNNLNALGSFWSMTEPDETEKLEVEIKLFREYATRTMENLVKEAELKVAAGKLLEVTPRMHFAMDYLGKQATWHMTMHHMVACPNCGSSIKEGIVYHKNDFGDRCIVDMDRYIRLFPTSPEALALKDTEEVKPAKKGRGKAE